MSTTGGRRLGTHGHSSSNPAVVRLAPRMLLLLLLHHPRSHHPPLHFTQTLRFSAFNPPNKVVKLLLLLLLSILQRVRGWCARTVTSRLHPDAVRSTHLSRWRRRRRRGRQEGEGPVRRFLRGLLGRCRVSTTFRTNSRDAGSRMCPPWCQFEHRSRCAIRATEPERHRKTGL